MKIKIWLVAATAATALAAGCGDDSTGLAGPPAWDLNGNGQCDLADEDINLDGVCDMEDAAGPPGTACWDLD
ncbi:MAG: hypothetical protein QME96_15275, partial [Myxococcota bacterium]|nr:hypothetical protein [Myxococcota bacterium]